jgi:hypothetical protein
MRGAFGYCARATLRRSIPRRGVFLLICETQRKRLADAVAFSFSRTLSANMRSSFARRLTRNSEALTVFANRSSRSICFRRLDIARPRSRAVRPKVSAGRGANLSKRAHKQDLPCVSLWSGFRRSRHQASVTTPGVDRSEQRSATSCGPQDDRCRR